MLDVLKIGFIKYLDNLDPETHWKKSRQTLDHGDSFFQEFQTTSVASCDEDYALCKTNFNFFFNQKR